MAEVPRIGRLEIEEDINFQRWEWRVSRVGWMLMVLVLLAAVLGLFGNGIFSETNLRDGGGSLEARVQRFARHSAPATLELSLGPGATADGKARVWIDRGYLSGSTVNSISPQPASVEAQDNRLVYVFNVSEPRFPVLISYALETDAIGLRHGSLGVEDGPELAFWQFVYP